MKKIEKIFWGFLASIVSGILYRLGGSDGWNTKIRDLGCATVGLLTMIFIVKVSVIWWIHLASFILLFGALTTYWDNLFGYDNFYFHGFMCAFSYFPYAIELGFWWQFGTRAIICAGIIGLINYLANKHKWKYRDIIEEVFRGFMLNITLLLFLI